MRGSARKTTIAQHLLGVALVAIAGCSAERTLGPRDIDLASTTRLDLRVQVVLSDTPALRRAEWRTSSGDTIVIHLGDALVRGSEAVARSLFRDVVVTTDGTPLPDRETILEPRVIAIEQSRPLFTFQDQHTTMVMEWALRDASGRSIWVKALRTHRQAEMGGWDAEDRSVDLVGQVVDDLLRQALTEIGASPEIRQFAAHRRGQ